jgi:AraC-like DNA-binding protein
MGVQELAVVGLVGSGVGAALGVPMACARGQQPSNPRVLGLVVVLLSAIAALISARLAGVVPASAAVEHAINLTGLAAFASAVIYVCRATGLACAVGWTTVLFAPAALYAVLLAGRGVFGFGSRVPFVWLLPIALAFTLASATVLWRRRRHAHAALIPPTWIVGFMFVLNVAQVVRMDLGHIPAVRALVPLVCVGGFVAMVAFVAWRTVGAQGFSESAVPARYERSGLGEAAALELLARIDHGLDAGRLFARADLTLVVLADAVSSTPHQVSEALNRFRGQTFHDLVNRRRVDDVKVHLADPASDRYTIEGIGASAGFGSRSALYAAFQKFEGQTPTAFRASTRTP